MSGKLRNYKRVEKKTKTDSFEKDSHNIWKGMQSHKPPPTPRGTASGLLSRPGGKNTSFSTQAPDYKGKKHEKKRLQLLMFITQSHPSAMVWGKSWKYNKCLPPAEGAAATAAWGQCWMFVAQQPYTEEGKSWPNGPNTLDPQSLCLWKRADHRVMDSRDIESSPLTEQWLTSWRKADMNQTKKTSSASGESVTKCGLFAHLVETQLRNAALCSLDWTESWKATKPASQHTVPHDVLMNEVVARKQDKDRGVTSRWEECWTLANHHGCNNSKLLQSKHCPSPEWATSWKTAAVASNNQNDNGAYDDCSQTQLHQISNWRSRDLHLQLCNYLCNDVLPEWSKSWQVVKNNLKPSEEMEKVLKAFESLEVKENQNELYLTSEKVDEQVKHKNEPTVEQSWEESWRMSKHQHQCAASHTTNQKLGEGSHYSYDLQALMRCIRPVSDWQVAWMVSESSFQHNKPSLSQWQKAWMSPTWNMQHWAEQMPRAEGDNEAMEIQPLKEAKPIISQCMGSQTFSDRHPMKEWSASWKASSLLDLQPSLSECSGTPGKDVSSTTQQQRGSEHGSKFPRSFRIANPMPHMDEHWVESSPNPYRYTVLWPAGKNTIQNKINTSCGQNPAALRLWQNSHMFVNVASAQINMSKETTDPRVIVVKETKTRKHLCSYTKKEQSDRKWAGCHLLGKSQPRPKKTSASIQKPRMDDEAPDSSFEEWVESWRYFVQPGILKKNMLNKSLFGWSESWKFLLPPQQPGNGPRAK